MGQVLPDDDELPPWLGAHLQDVTSDIYRAASEAAQESTDHDD